MSVTREELQEAGASPELARILADRWPGRGPGDLTSSPMAVTLSGVALAAFLSIFAWLALGVTGLQTDMEIVKKDVALLDTRMSGIESQVTLLREGQATLAERMTRIEEKLDRLLQE